jgi:hypothetical protein
MQGLSQVVSQLRAALRDRSTSAQAKLDRAEAILESIDFMTPPSIEAVRADVISPVARGGLAHGRRGAPTTSSKTGFPAQSPVPF